MEHINYLDSLKNKSESMSFTVVYTDLVAKVKVTREDPGTKSVKTAASFKSNMGKNFGCLVPERRKDDRQTKRKRRQCRIITTTHLRHFYLQCNVQSLVVV